MTARFISCGILGLEQTLIFLESSYFVTYGCIPGDRQKMFYRIQVFFYYVLKTIAFADWLLCIALGILFSKTHGFSHM